MQALTSRTLAFSVRPVERASGRLAWNLCTLIIAGASSGLWLLMVRVTILLIQWLS